MKRGEIKGNLVTLKPLKESYFGDYLVAFSPQVRELLHVVSGESEIVYLKDRLEKQEAGKTFFYCIFTNKENKLVGAIEIRSSQETGSQLYSWVNEKYWGTGLYQEALLLTSKKYFMDTDQELYRANVDVSNIRSYLALKKFGFVDCAFGKGPYGNQYKLLLRKK